MVSGVDIVKERVTAGYFLTWEKVVNSDGKDAGGKGKNLGRLYRYGFSVPAGGALTAASYRDFLKHDDMDGLMHAAAAIRADEIFTGEKILEEIRQKINDGKIPETIIHEDFLFICRCA